MSRDARDAKTLDLHRKLSFWEKVFAVTANSANWPRVTSRIWKNNNILSFTPLVGSSRRFNMVQQGSYYAKRQRCNSFNTPQILISWNVSTVRVLLCIYWKYWGIPMTDILLPICQWSERLRSQRQDIGFRLFQPDPACLALLRTSIGVAFLVVKLEPVHGSNGETLGKDASL